MLSRLALKSRLFLVSLTGMVLDAATGQPLPDAHILIASNLDQHGAVANSQGLFNLPSLLPGVYDIQASYLGYVIYTDTLNVHPGTSQYQHIALDAEPLSIAPIVIDGQKQQLPSNSIELVRQSVDAQRLERAQDAGRQITDRLIGLPGVQVAQVTADIHIQGGEAGENQFRLDDVPVFLPPNLAGIIGPFSPFAIQSITVHKTGFGIEEGSLLSGILNARHDLPSRAGSLVQIDPLSINGRLQYKRDLRQGKAALMVAGRQSLWDYYQPPALSESLNEWNTPDPFIIFGPLRSYSSLVSSELLDDLGLEDSRGTGMSFSDLHAAGRWESPKHRVFYASYYRGQSSLDRNFSTVSSSFENDAENDLVALRLSDFTIDDDYSWRNETGQLSFSTLVGSYGLFNTQLSGSLYDHENPYTVIDSLEKILDFEVSEAGIPADNLTDTVSLPQQSITDKNAIREYGVSADFEYARYGHLLKTGLEFTYTESEFDLLLPTLNPFSPLTQDTTSLFTVTQNRLSESAAAYRIAFYAGDRFPVGKRLHAEIGVRLTHLETHAKIFAEPRFAIRGDLVAGKGTISHYTAAGLFRQYINQFDISTFDASALLPSRRIWIPLDRSISPPLAFHLAHQIAWQITPSFSLNMEGYFKLQPQLLSINYLQAENVTAFAGGRNFSLAEASSQQQYLLEGKGKAYGFSTSFDLKGNSSLATIRYSYAHSDRTFERLFDGITMPTPWNEPHRIDGMLGWTPDTQWSFSLRYQGIWGRSWGFRRAYYDFLGHQAGSRHQPPFDFGNPGTHRLPAWQQIDAGLAREILFSSMRLQIRLDVLNLLGRENTVDWRIVFEDESLVKESRSLQPRMIMFSIRWIP